MGETEEAPVDDEAQSSKREQSSKPMQTHGFGGSGEICPLMFDLIPENACLT